MTAKTRANLISGQGTSVNNNTTGDISADDVRSELGHLADSAFVPLTDTAAEVPFTPASNIAATTVQAAIVEVNDRSKRGFLWGLTLSNNATDTTNDIDIAAGVARNSTDADDMTLAAAITKRLDAAWAVGSGSGGLDQGSIANATYHTHLIKRLDTGVVDAIFSLSHDKRNTVTMTIASPAVVTWGHGLVAGSPFKFETTGALPTGVVAGTQYYVIATGLTATTFQFSASNGGAAVNSSGAQSGVHTGVPGPQMPTGYTLFRRIGSIMRVAAAIRQFRQYGDQFKYSAGVVDYSTLTNRAAANLTISVPVGIVVNSMHSMVLTAAAAGNAAVFMQDGDFTTGLQRVAQPNAAGVISLTVAPIYNTNSSAQVVVETSDFGGTDIAYLDFITLGYIDTRGRLAQ